MSAERCLLLAVCVLAVGIGAAIHLAMVKYKVGRFITPVKCMWVSVFVAAVLLFVPVHAEQMRPGVVGNLKCIVLAIHSTMRLFVLDGEFDLMAAFTEGFAVIWMGNVYSSLAAMLYVLAPVLTFGFVLSFFRSASAHRALLFHYKTDMFVFSELNEQALIMAESLKKKNPRALIAYTDISSAEGDGASELYDRAKALPAALFSKDITTVDWGFHSKSKCVSFFMMGEDETANVRQSVRLMDRYGEMPNHRLYVFSSGIESELLFRSVSDNGMKVRRIDVTRSFVNQLLYREGDLLFRNAMDTGERKKISIVVLGVGEYGSQMLRALTWFCQMDGYQVEIHVFDKDEKAEQRFSMTCPELMAPERNGSMTPGEAEYRIVIHSGVDVQTLEFSDLLNQIGAITHVFVMLGEDSLNIKTAVHMRMLMERNHYHPVIQAIVYDSLKKDMLESVTDYRGHRYDVEFVGDLATTFSSEILLDSELEQQALQRHLKWGNERDFWAYEFNHASSIAAAIHQKMRVLCNIPGANKRECELTERERDILECLEHRRWNAYMRSEGFVYSGSTAQESRNDLAKLHNDLVPIHMLTEEERRKDSKVGSK